MTTAHRCVPPNGSVATGCGERQCRGNDTVLRPREAGITRRAFLGQTVGAAGLLGLGADRAGVLGFLSDTVLPGVAAAEPPPETTRIRIVDLPATCVAPQLLAEELLRAEGFTEIQYVKWTKGIVTGMVASNQADLTSNDAPSWVMAIDGGVPVTMLAGVHVGCYELFGNEPIRTIRDLRGKTISVPALRSGRHAVVASMALQVGLDPARDLTFVAHPPAEGMRLFAEGKVDAFIGWPPETQYLRANRIGRLILSTLTDRPWSQYFCCILAGHREFVQRHPVATKRALRAILKAAAVCALEPERVARFLVDRGTAKTYDHTLQALKELPYARWREYNPEEAVRYYALRLNEAGWVRSNPKKIIADGTDWRFLNELKKELKA